METTLPTLPALDSLAQSAVNLQRDAITRWSDWCQRFLENQRQAMGDHPLTREDEINHRRGLRLLLYFGRHYQSMMDPELFDSRTRKEVSGRMGQLEESWQLVHEPRMTDAEADAFLAKHFPECSRMTTTRRSIGSVTGCSTVRNAVPA